MKKLILLALVLLPLGVGAQSFNGRFMEHMQKKDYKAAGKVIAKWEASPEGSSPEFFIAAFNYYFRESRKSVLTLGQNPTGEALTFYNKEDTEKKSPAGYIYDDVYFDKALLDKSFGYIDRGISEYPDRLDMRFGKIYALKEAHRYEGMVTDMVAAVEYSAEIGSAWLWSGNEAVEDAEEFFFSSMQDYIMELYETDEAADYMEAVASVVLEYYPDNVVNINNMGIACTLRGDVDTALGYYLKAHELAPGDCIVLANVAELYVKKKMIPDAVVYLEKIVATGNPEYKTWAEKYIAALRKE